MDIHHLETFLAVAEEKGFSRAAKRLRRTQPAVSQIIRKLESDLNEVLFERSARDGTLTAAGEVSARLCAPNVDPAGRSGERDGGAEVPGSRPFADCSQ